MSQEQRYEENTKGEILLAIVMAAVALLFLGLSAVKGVRRVQDEAQPDPDIYLIGVHW